MQSDQWTKSSKSGPYTDNCVEVRAGDGDMILVRDSKLGENSPVLSFSQAEWEAFIKGAKASEFDI